ncbi:MAG: PepSY domain-containing protein [Luteimonas sp.]
MKVMSMHCLITIAFATAGFATSPATAATPPAQHSLASQAKLTRAAAERIALAKVPSGAVKTAELEREHGTLVWSFDIAVPGSKDIHEVQVDAKNGMIVASEIETPDAQARERAADKRERAASTRQH